MLTNLHSRGAGSLSLLLALVLLLASCGGSTPSGSDASSDASSEASADAAVDTTDTADTTGTTGITASSGSEASSDAAGEDPASSGAAESASSIELNSDAVAAVTRPVIDWCAVPTAANSPALTEDGKQMFAQRLQNDDEYPTYQLAATIDPDVGRVTGSMRAVIPDQNETLAFRIFPGVPSFNADLAVGSVWVDGVAVSPNLDQALLTIENPSPNGNADAVIEMSFSYNLQETAASGNLLEGLTGESLEPAKVGLLGRTDFGAQLGHWFPVWLPPVSRADSTLDGFGDIGAFPAAGICLDLTAPSQYSVITGGVRVGEATDAGSGLVTLTESGLGLRDMAVLLTRDTELVSADVDGVTVKVWGPADDPESNRTVLDFATSSQASLTRAFGPYPWKEIDLVSVPLGSGVGGMEWPGMLWIEENMYAGGIPGLGSLADTGLFSEDTDMEGLDDILSSDFFQDAIEGLPGGEAVATSLEWTVAHELGHEWWHAVVGNDSIESPAVDEPLAQFAACIAMRNLHPDNWRDICEAQTLDTYSQSRGLFDIEDVPAEQASDAFESSVQYAAIVYGKAPGFYFEAADLLGWDAVEGALRSFIAEHPFELVATDVLRDHLVAEAGDQGAVIGELWDRWFREAYGDEDIGVAETANLGSGSIDLTELLGDDVTLADLGDISEVFGDPDLEALLGENTDLAELFGDDPDISELLGEDSPFADLVEELLGEG